MPGKHETWFDAYEADMREHKKDVSVARLAAVYHVSDQTIYNQQNGHQQLTLEQYSQYCTELARTGKSPEHLIAWFCRQGNYMCAPLPPVGASINVRVPKMLSEFGDVTKATADAIEDDRVTIDEAARVWTEGEQAISAILGVMHAARAAAVATPLRPGTLAEAERKGTA